jgi:hypothetical protein
MVETLVSCFHYDTASDQNFPEQLMKGIEQDHTPLGTFAERRGGRSDCVAQRIQVI